MQMFPCSSARIASYGFEPSVTRVDGREVGLLAIQFHDKSTWFYAGVPLSVFENFLMADSKGAFLARYVQPQYEGTKEKA